MLSYGAILWNGAGFSHPDDLFASKMDGWGNRPLLTLSYMFNRHLGGWMLMNLACHVLAAILVFRLSNSMLAGCLFGAHPMAADAVASVAGRSSVLCAVFIFSALLVLRHGRWVAWVILGVCAFLVKQEAVALLLLSPALLLVDHKWRQAAILAVVSVILALVLWVAWHPFLKQTGDVPSLTAVGLQSAPGQWEYFHRFASAVGGYIVPRMIVPVRLSADPDVSYSWKSEIVGWLVMPMVLPMVPYALAPLPDVFLEHRAYLSLAVAAMLLAWALRERPIFTVVVVVLFVAASAQRAFVYAEPARLWEDATIKGPSKGRPHINLAVIYASKNQYGAAERELKQAVRVAPEISLGWTSLAALHLIQGDMASASRVLDSREDYIRTGK